MAIVLDKTYAQAAPLALPFLLGDTIKAVLAGIVTGYIAHLRPHMIGTGH
jgi:biotin transport system substrate-specific component